MRSECCTSCGLPSKGSGALIVYQFTEEQLEDLVEKIALRTAAGPKKAWVKVSDAAHLLGVSKDTITRRIRAGVIQTLPDVGVMRISMEEIERLNSEKKKRRK